MFFKILIFFVLFYYAFKYLGQFLFPRIIKRYVSKFQQGQSQQYQQEERPVGKVTITKNVKKEKKVNRDSGDYVDFEEVD